MSRFAFSLLATVLAACLVAPATAGTYETFGDALDAAAAADKPLLIDVFAEWCGPCKRFTADYEADAEAQAAFAERAVLFKIDAEKGAGIHVARRYSVNSYPSFVMVDAAGEVMDRWVGYADLESWMETVTEATTDPMTRTDRVAAFRERPSADQAVKLAELYFTEGLHGQALAYFERARDLEPERKGLDAQVFLARAGGVRGGLYTSDGLTDAVDRALADPKIDDSTKRDVVYQLYNAARAVDDMTLYAPYVATGLEVTADATEGWPKSMHEQLQIHDALYVRNDPRLAYERRLDQMPEGWQENPRQLNSIAWWCFQNEIALDDARDHAMRGAELATDDAVRANVLDTLAEICNLTGDCDQAVAYIEQAIELDPDREFFREQLVRFEEAAATSDE